MGINIFFVISFLVLLSGLICFYKKPEKISLLKSIIICYITELCLGAIVVWIYSIVGVSICLVSLGSAYFLMGILVWIMIINQKKIQRLEIVNIDVYSISIILLWFLITFIIVFSPQILNVYTNSDPANHYSFALRMMDTGKVSTMYFAEVYNAIIMKLFEPFIVRINLYKAFILADSLANLLNVLMFYVLATSFFESRFIKIILPFLSFLYFAGWPFFSYVVGGFVYFGWGVTLFAYVVYLLIKLYNSEYRRNQIALFILVLIGCFSELVCYMLFAPILYVVVFISLVCVAKKNQLAFPKRYKLIIGLLVLVIAIVAFYICFWGFFQGDLTAVFNALKTDGGIAKELYQDFIFLMPAVFYMGWRCIKNKKLDFAIISVIVILGYIGCTFILCLCGVISPYYYYKSYYLLWLFAWIINIAAMEHFWVKDKAILFAYSGTILFAIFITLSGFDSKLEEKGIVVDEVSEQLYASPFPIFDRMEMFLGQEHYLKDKEALIDVSKYIMETFKGQESVPMISDVYWLDKWYNCFTGNNGIYIVSDEEFAGTLQECKNIGYKYILIYQNTERYRNNLSLLEDYQIIYNNGYFGLYMGEVK